MSQVSKMSAKEIFRAAVKGNNFMTPDILGYEKVSDNTAAELSEGSGFKGERIFGVTVVSAEEKNGRIEYVRRDDLNKLCWSRKEANDHIDELRSLLGEEEE